MRIKEEDLLDGKKPSFGYKFAYNDFLRDENIYYLFPFNKLVIFIRKLYLKLCSIVGLKTLMDIDWPLPYFKYFLKMIYKKIRGSK